MFCSAGIAFDFGTAFGIVMVGSIVGMSVQYWVARYLFKDKVRTPLCVCVIAALFAVLKQQQGPMGQFSDPNKQHLILTPVRKKDACHFSRQ